MDERNKTPTEQDDRGREDGNNGGVTAFLHNSVDNRDSETAEDGGKSTHAHVGDMSLSVAVADILEAEGAIIANKPARKTKEEFREGRVYVEVVLSCDVIGGEFAEMDFIETEASCT